MTFTSSLLRSLYILILLSEYLAPLKGEGQLCHNSSFGESSSPPDQLDGKANVHVSIFL